MLVEKLYSGKINGTGILQSEIKKLQEKSNRRNEKSSLPLRLNFERNKEFDMF